MPGSKGKGLLERSGMSRDTRVLLSGALAELLGTFLLVFLGCMGTLSGPLGKDLPHIQIGVAFGLVVGACIATFGHISGAHFNPAVTVLSLIMRLVDPKTAIIYIVVQCLGAVLGFGLLKAVTPCSLWGQDDVVGNCGTVPHVELSALQALAAETIVTALLLMLCAAVWDPRNKDNTDSTPIKFGFYIVAVALVEGPYTGGSMNPARTLGPAVWNGVWTKHWVYWLGPLTASVLVGYIWPLLFSPVEDEDVPDHADVPLTHVSADGKRRSKAEDADVKGNLQF